MFLTSHLLLQCFQKPSLFGSSKIGMSGTQTYTRGIDFLCGKKVFKPPFSPSFTMFSKAFPFWIVKTRDRLVLKFTREVLISSSAKKATSLICRYGVYGHRLVFNKTERSRKYNKWAMMALYRSTG